MRDLVLLISELMFYLTGGEQLVNTIWIISFLVVIVFIALWPAWFLNFGNKHQKIATIYTLVMFFPMIFVTSGVGIAQAQIILECRKFEQLVVGELSTDTKMHKFQECRVKENYYGEWKLQ